MQPGKVRAAYKYSNSSSIFPFSYFSCASLPRNYISTLPSPVSNPHPLTLHNRLSSTNPRFHTPRYQSPLTVNILHTFPFSSWCENLAVQSNGRILVSRLDTPEVIQVDPTGILSLITIASFDTSEYRGCAGISETVEGLFYVITSAFVGHDFVRTRAVYEIVRLLCFFIAQNRMDELGVLRAGSSEAVVVAGSNISVRCWRAFQRRNLGGESVMGGGCI